MPTYWGKRKIDPYLFQGSDSVTLTGIVPYCWELTMPARTLVLMGSIPNLITEKNLLRKTSYGFGDLLDDIFFIAASLCAIWLAWLILSEGFKAGWGQIWFYLIFWVVLAYIILPRFHQLMTDIYVPKYFIGRSLTEHGLLGDPVNLAVVGSEAQLHKVMQDAGWTKADDVSLLSSWRIITSVLLGKSYPNAPVSPLFVFGKMQSFAYQQEVSDSASKRHHVRFWKCPEGWILPGGLTVDWLGAGTFDRAVGFSLFTLQITHKIDADIDKERDFIVAGALAADEKVSVEAIEDFSTGYHSRNGGGDGITTDGDLPVLDIRQVVAETAAEQHAEENEQTVVQRDWKLPFTTVFSSGTLLLSAVADLISTILQLTHLDELRKELIDSSETPQDAALLQQDPSMLEAEVWSVIVVVALVILLKIIFAVLLLRGSSLARTTILILGFVGIAFQAVDFYTGGNPITLNANLLQVSLYILVIVALSGKSARDYARFGKKWQWIPQPLHP